MAASYAERPERRRLPSMMEWLSILTSTRPDRWSTAERRLMGAATRLHLGRAALAGAIGVGTWLAIRENRDQERANALMHNALLADFPALIPMMPDVLRAIPRFSPQDVWRMATDPARRGREHRTAPLLAYLTDPTPDRAEALLARLPHASPEEVGLIAEAIAPHLEHARTDRLRIKLLDDSTDPPARLRLVASLARLDPAAVDLGPQAPTLAQALIGEERRTVPLWIDLLGPALPKVAPKLEEICDDAGREPGSRANAAEALAGLRARLGDPRGLALAVVRACPDAAIVLIQGLVHRFDDKKPAMEALKEVMDEPDADPTKEDEVEKLAARKANAAVALAALGKVEVLGPLLHRGDDPRLRTRLIHALARSEILKDIALARLAAPRGDVDPGERQALLMALAEADSDAIGAAARGVGAGLAASIYSNEPDGGIHSAARLLLRRWHRDDLIDQADKQFPRTVNPDKTPDRGWFVSPGGQTFVVLRGPLTFRMGSPAHEADRFDNEALHTRRIGRSLAVATTEVTDAQFRKFRPNHDPEPRYGTEPDGPAHQLTWFDWIRYCNWLSREEKLEPCYPDPVPVKNEPDPVPVKNEKVKYEVLLPDDVTARNGYRLPTEAEWEFICRAGTTTSRFFGTSDELLPRYAWTWLNSSNRTHPVASLLPNPLGLFDTLGNAWEWCQEGTPEKAIVHTPPYPRGTGADPAPDLPPGELVKHDETRRVLRGGAYPYSPSDARSAKRYDQKASNDEPTFGLRVVRTLR
jgi:formylglycine-generating enzyme required for sulfatase activity